MLTLQSSSPNCTVVDFVSVETYQRYFVRGETKQLAQSDTQGPSKMV